ncbi:MULTISPECIES: alpha/beta hydrolase [unclassified Streptomyces]|uniref:alpha/beta hydrolase n=1 Tax=unclassified Streptomyces TaxID=2593676 RepID=UPI000DACB5FC|nr:MULTISPECIES: alpha/beta hydrolase [unclassified Streptomyces]PZT77573.1 alpha/beta hydrolase [Streptomyces sp. AC1-42W]PZT78473.1 alpha/beta hydrolase [Streptomyces sp. AC1-42T]
MRVTPVPFDPALGAVLDSMPRDEESAPGPDSVTAIRDSAGAFPMPPVAEVIGDRAVDSEELTIPGPEGAPGLAVTVLRPRGLTEPVPALYNIHGGGMISGHRHQDTPRLVDLVDALGVVAVNVEYRLAPEHPDPAPVEDCYAGLRWMTEYADELGIDPGRVVVMGGSAGGGLAAGVALLARDRQGPRLAGQLLLCPMLDDTNSTVSSHQYTERGTWRRPMNILAWQALLGDDAGDPAAPVSPYAAPTRATDLSNLPPAFVEVGAAELFRDEDVNYASRIWAAGGHAELHVWQGAFHGFDVFAPDHEATRAALASRRSWLRRVLGL